jgi:hypothetical protein
MKKILCALLALTSVICLAGCVNHNDGVCDNKDCDATLTVVRYNEKTELCLKHAIEEGLEKDK